MYEAARKTDEVSHHSWKASLIGGAIVGCVVGFCVQAGVIAAAGALGLTGVGIPAAVALIAVAGVAGGAAGGAVGGAASGAIGTYRWSSGKIDTGAKRVKIGHKEAARAQVDKISCHKPQVIAEGSRTVLIEGFPAARIGDRTQCGGTISQGYPTVKIGLDPGIYEDIANDMKVPREVRIGMGVVMVLLGALGVKGIASNITRAATPKNAVRLINTEPPIRGSVQSRINLANGPTRFTPLRASSGQKVSAGWIAHIVKEHFNRPLSNNRSIFSISQGELKTVLQRSDVVASPVRAIKGGQFVRIANTGKVIGNTALKYGGKPTTWIKVFTDKAGNIITTYPVPAPK